MANHMNAPPGNCIPSLLIDAKPVFMQSNLAIQSEDAASPDGRGRRVVSRCDIAQGTILLVELPLVMSGTAAPSLRESVVDLCRNLDPFRDQIAMLEQRDSAWMRSVAQDLDGCIELPLVSRTVNNCFKTKIGSGWHTTVYLHLSFFNHSCNPNASATLAHHAPQGADTSIFKEHPRVIFAIQDIKAGDEVCIDYLGHQADLPRHMRQHHLLEGWGFNCRCSRCQKEASLDYCSTIAIPIGFVCASLPMLIAINDDWEAVESALCQGNCWRDFPGQRMLEELNGLLKGSLDEPLGVNPNTCVVSYCVLVGKALIQAAEGGHFELSMEDLQKLMSIMAQHVMNLQLLLPALHNSVVAMYSNLLEMQAAMADSDDEDEDNQGSHEHPTTLQLQVHRSIVAALQLSRIQWMEMSEQERQERLQVPFGSCAV